ncbi:MAG: serine/threonine-protein kinase [Isosphaeraceae bacterium]
MLHERRLIDRLQDDMERRWADGGRVFLEEYLASHPSLLEDPDALLELILKEIDLLAAEGKPPRWEAYRAALPETIVTRLREYLEFEAVMDSTLTGPEDDGLPRFPNFEVISKIGGGSMGIVYLARDLKTKELVAIKALYPDSPIEQVDWFKAEFRSLAEQDHPNLVKLYELFYDGLIPFFTMEYVDGCNFLEYVERGPARWERLLKATRQLADGLMALHGAGKVHRDIKPSNVLVTLEGRVVILDFGLAIDQRPWPGQGTDFVGGSGKYAAPEI